MKTFMLILCCSALAAIGGYYYYEVRSAEKRQSPPPLVEPESPAEPTPIEADPVVPPVPETIVETTPITVDPMAERAVKPLQTLTDTQGRRIQAKVLSVNGTQVKIRRSDGREMTFPMSMLSADDIAFCEYLRDKPANQSDEIIAWESIFDS